MVSLTMPFTQMAISLRSIATGEGYPSQLENKVDRLTRKAEKLRERLGSDSCVFNSIPGKPPRTYWWTYWRLTGEILEVESQLIAELLILFEKLSHKKH